MVFHDIPEDHLPERAQYYFNVLAITIGISEKEWAEHFPAGANEIWYIERLTDSKPRVYYFYMIDICGEGEEEVYIEAFSHQVVEIHPTFGVCLYDMLDFDT